MLNHHYDPPLVDIFMAGAEARIAGRHADDNPYIIDDERHGLWAGGYEATPEELPAAPTPEATAFGMLLPPGMVCGDCAHWTRCKALIQDLDPAGIACDFAPSRFRRVREVTP
jgi:hypothetical protein